MPYVWFVTICLIWGSSFILMKRAVECLSPISIGAGRSIGGALALAVIMLILRQPRKLQKQDVLPLLGVVLLGFVWPHSIQPEMVARHGGAFVGMTVGFTPLLTLIVSIPILGIWPTSRQLFGVMGALVCMLVLFNDLSSRSIPATDIAITMSVPLTYSIANGLVRRKLEHLPPLELTLLCLIVASAVLVPISLTVENPRLVNHKLLGISILSLVILGVLGTGIATFLFNRLVQQQGPLFAVMTTNVVPVGAVIWGRADGEPISKIQMIALLGVLVMVTVVQIGSAKASDVSIGSNE